MKFEFDAASKTAEGPTTALGSFMCGYPSVVTCTDEKYERGMTADLMFLTPVSLIRRDPGHINSVPR